MIVQIAKDHKHYEILYESQEEAQVVADYQNQLLVRGFDERAYFQHEQEAYTE